MLQVWSPRSRMQHLLLSPFEDPEASLTLPASFWGGIAYYAKIIVILLRRPPCAHFRSQSCSLFLRPGRRSLASIPPMLQVWSPRSRMQHLLLSPFEDPEAPLTLPASFGGGIAYYAKIIVILLRRPPCAHFRSQSCSLFLRPGRRSLASIPPMLQVWSPREESNLRPKLYESLALPAELRGQII